MVASNVYVQVPSVYVLVPKMTMCTSLPVTVVIAGRGEVRGELVRLETIGDGRIGIAVRFDEAKPELAS